jgi:hypothetical protein
VRKRLRTWNPNQSHRSPKARPPRSSPCAGSDHIKRVVAALRNAESGLKNAAKEFRNNALRATSANHPIEAALNSRLACRFGSLEEFVRNYDEINELKAWLPMPAQHRKASPSERNAYQIRFIRSLNLDSANRGSLISLATQQPGRFPETRGVAVRSEELHMTGRSWREIEKRLLPHLRNAKNPGRSICREVQFLRKVLKRYGVFPFNQTA